MKLRPLSFAARTAPAQPLMKPLGSESERRRTVVVALRRDAAGRDLLTWALVKAAAPGDRVVALHVSATGEQAEEKSAGAAAAADTLASVLGAYKGFCDRNQIELELRVVCDGPASVKRALVAEAASYCAAHLVLGVAANKSSGSRSSAVAVARYCAKRVPPSCAVTAVSSGVVVYQRDAVQQQQQQQQQRQLSHCSSMVETPRRLYRKLLDATTTTPATGDTAQDDLAIGDGDGRSARRRNMSASSFSALASPRVRLLRPLRSLKPELLPEVAAGWPLLKKDIKSIVPESAATEVSVVQWAMNLPTRWSQVSPPVMNSEQGVEEAKSVPLPQELVSLRDKYASKYTVFSYSELAKITDNFSSERLVGKGGAGRVYRGRTRDGREVAVKVLKPSDHAIDEFTAEVDVLSSVEHGNAVSLVGICLDDAGATRLMLVYEYVRRGSLEELLHGEKGNINKGTVFGWPERFKVAVGVARALEYLHRDEEGEPRPVIHRDVKSSNILVDDDCEPKLCDFGLALRAADAAAQVTDDDVAGTFGYLAPEYFMHGKVSDKLDVYAFGVVLLELVSGRKPVSSSAAAKGGQSRESLVMWASSVLRTGKVMDLVDPSMPPPQADADGEAAVVERMVLAAALCIRRAPQRRPSMTNVVKLLTGDGDAVRWAKSQVLGVSGGGSEDGGSEDSGSGVVPYSPEDMSDIQSYINLALLDDDAGSVGSSVDFVGANMSLEEYMKERWSRSSSFNS